MGDCEQVVFCQDRDPLQPARIRFDDLAEIVQTRQPSEVLAKLEAVERAVEDGLYAAGFMTYEAASGIDEAMRTHPVGELPLVWFGLFRRMIEPDSKVESGSRGGFSVGPWLPSITREQYDWAIDRIRDYIARGHTYQVNYAFRLRAEFRGDSWDFFRRLCRAQRGQYGAYLDIGQHVICSVSPELFFELNGDLLVARPMKGTYPRGLTCEGDRRRRLRLAQSIKDRAENAMVVDMMRNDVGRVARPGSVIVASAFDVEKYPTLYQMTSTVAARTSASIAEIMNAAFPSASITGAPKIRTMEIIRELEPDCRGVYTGCIGWIAPGRKARFSVAIRTVTIDRHTSRAEYGVGGGIVWDSDKTGEFAECATKAAVLTAETPQFELLETLLYDREVGFSLLDGHLERLAESAEYFDFAVDMQEVRNRLDAFARGLPGGAHRVRLLMGQNGQISVESAPLPAEIRPGPVRLKLADRPISSRNVFLYHKTTCRGVYEAAYASRGDCDDVLLWNEQGAATETTIANLVVEKGGRLITPPVSCGVLPGVFREHLLHTGEIEEQIVSVEDVKSAQRLFAVNSVRGWMPAVLGERSTS
jgi:para-aminobenzoate synthetase / 4-amino-4-deoxychorismate lyase